MQKVKTNAWITLPIHQATDDLLWEMTRCYNSYLVKDHGVTLSRDPLNLTGLNTKRDSGIACSKAIGIGINVNEQKVKEKKAKKKANVVKFALRLKTKRVIPKKRLVALKEGTAPHANFAVYTESTRITARAIAKALNRNLAGYRKDLLPLAVRRLRKLNKFKNNNKNKNRSEAKKVKA